MIDIMNIFWLLSGTAVGFGLATFLLKRHNRRRRDRSRVFDALTAQLFHVNSEEASQLPLDRVKTRWQDSLHEQRRLKAVLMSMPEGLALLDGKNTVMFCNDGFVTMFRTRVNQTLQLNTVADDDKAGFAKALSDAGSFNQVATTSLSLTTTPPREILVTLTPHTDERITGGIVLTAVDITEQKRIEAMRSEFVANVSHELRTPLAAIRGYVETCLEPVEEGQEPPYRRFLGIIHQHALRLNALIEDLLVLSRIESQAIQLKFDSINVYTVVDNAIATLRNEADKKDVALYSSLPPMLPRVRADERSLERILMNLIENAVKYSDGKSEVRITGRTTSDKVCIMVEDQGLGIPKEDQTRIFERFYRVDKARSRKAGGTGLGLSIVKHLVLAHGGEIWVDSEPGRGSTFFFTLPMSHASEEIERLVMT